MNTDTRQPSSPNEAYRGFYKVIAPLVMCSGIGDGQTTACVMAQAATIDALRKGQTLDKPDDEMECACPLLRRIAICANDTNWWENDAERTEFLRPLIPLLLDSKRSEAVTWKRIYFMADQSVRMLTPMRLEFIAAHTKSEKLKAEIDKGIETIKAIKPITDKASAIAAREACRALNATASTYASADAYADAAYSSATASAYASADASSADAAYASAAYAAYVIKSQSRKYRDAYLQLFREVAAINE